MLGMPRSVTRKQECPCQLHSINLRGKTIISSRSLQPYNTRVLQLQLNKMANSRGHVENVKGGWRFFLDKGKSGIYRLAQMDDYNQLGRRNFPHRPPFRLDLHARASQTSSPGTWGFGLWNDPAPSVYF